MENGSKVVLGIIIVIMLIVFIGPFIVPIGYAVSKLNINIWTILLIALGIIIAWFVATYNKFVSLKQRVKQAKGGIDVYLKQRFDLIPNLVETVKGYKNYEEKVVENITKLRSEYETSKPEDVKQMEELNNKYSKLLALVESYPELKASESFLALQKALSKIESQLQAARRIYNNEVTAYNTTRYKFPSNIVGGMFGFKEEQLFEIEEVEKQNIDIKI